MYRYLNLKKLTFTRNDTALKRCPEKMRKTRRCGGAFTLLTLLVFATSMLLHTPVARAVDPFDVLVVDTDLFCQLSLDRSFDNFKIPELGGSYSFRSPDHGSYLQGKAIGAARLTGVIYGPGFSDENTFGVDIMLDSRLDPDDDGYNAACRNFALRCGSPNGWHVYTTLTGTLTGLIGTIDGVDIAGAVYNVTLSDTGLTCTEGGTTPAFQVGKGANTHNTSIGGFAKIKFKLADPIAYPDLPVGPFSGELSLKFFRLRYPVPSPDLTGTWTGVVDCAGMLDFSDVETFSGSMTLKVGPQSGLNYSAELSDDRGNVVATYCVEYTIDLRGGQINKGRMINSDTGKSVLLKVREDDSGTTVTLKAREFFNIQDGGDRDDLPDGLDFCKWTFTRIDDANPGITTLCLFDDDGDGVINAVDQCPATPIGETVEANGCSETEVVGPTL